LSLRNKKLLLLFSPALIVLVIDQITKQLVYNNPGLQRVNLIDGWLALNFTKNPGMAMGMDFLPTIGISIVAIIATIGIVTYILYTLESANFAYLLCMGLIIGGALGNITDRFIMGIIGGYGGVLEGHVVDFIHFNLTIGDWAVFPYIFNVADIAISTAIITMLVFHKRILPVEEEKATEDKFEEGKAESTATDLNSPTVDTDSNDEIK